MAYENAEGHEIEKVVVEVSKLSNFMNELSSNIYKLVDKDKADMLAEIMDEMEYDLVNESDTYYPLEDIDDCLDEAINLENAVSGLNRCIEEKLDGPKVDMKDVNSIQGLSAAIVALAKNHANKLEKQKNA